jgi:hypothetical protein
MEFYETTELRGQLDNWVGPNVPCLLAFTRTAGFARTKYEGALAERAHVTAFRDWGKETGTTAAPDVVCVENANTHSHTFSASEDDYITFYFRSADADLNCDNVRPIIGDFASRPIHVARTGESAWQATCKIPPGLTAGWHEATLAVASSTRCRPLKIGLDMGENLSWVAKRDAALAITRITDGKTFEDDMAIVGPGSAISVWATGLRDTATSADVSLRLNGTTLPAIWLAPASNGAPRQINALLPAGLETGPAAVSVVHAGKETPPRHVRLTHLRLA